MIDIKLAIEVRVRFRTIGLQTPNLSLFFYKKFINIAECYCICIGNNFISYINTTNYISLGFRHLKQAINHVLFIVFQYLIARIQL